MKKEENTNTKTKLEWNTTQLIINLKNNGPMENVTIEYADGRVEKNAKLTVSLGSSHEQLVICHACEPGEYSGSHYEYHDYGEKFWILK